MKKKIISIVAFMAFSLLLLTGCNPEFTQEKVMSCEQGEYSIPSDIQEKIKLSGIKGKSVNVVEYVDSCDAVLKLKKPQVVFGTEVSTMPLFTCDKYCMNFYGEMNDTYSRQDIFDRCCK